MGSSSGGGGGGGGCFISVTAQSDSWQGLWIFALIMTSLTFVFCIKARKAAPKV
jgi:hypothetical protein